MNQAQTQQPSDSNFPWSEQNKGHHAIFDQFPQFNGEVKAGFLADYIGSVVHKDFIVWDFPNEDKVVKAPLPNFEEEYFEWIDILESVQDAKDSYTIVELGAGYGRWSAIGVMAAKAKGIKTVHARLAEAEPKHVEWAHRHMSNNRIAQHEYSIHEVAVGGKTDKILFWAVAPKSHGVNSPQDWYGQSIVQKEMLPLAKNSNYTYMGRPLIDLSNGWGAIEVNMVPLGNVLAGLDHIDMIDMDVQEAEADVIESGIHVLNRKVRRVHIGTHSADVEERIRRALSAQGWIKTWDYPCQATSQTPYGNIKFGDGVQGWINPRLENGKKAASLPTAKLF